jgi:hypothetical protein
MHYTRWREHGDPTIVLIHQTPAGAPEAFLSDALRYDGLECKFWPFAKNNRGYAQINRDGDKLLVHRLICKAVNGPPPTNGHHAAHSCGNGYLACVTPRHVRWKTPAENASEMVEHGRSLRGTRAPLAKLTDADAIEIFRRAIAGEVQTEIAADFGIAQTLVSKIKLGKRWGWLTAQLRNAA